MFRKTLGQHGMDVAKLFGTIMLAYFSISGQIRTMVREEVKPLQDEFRDQMGATFTELGIRMDSLDAAIERNAALPSTPRTRARRK